MGGQYMTEFEIWGTCIENPTDKTGWKKTVVTTLGSPARCGQRVS